MIIPDLWRMDVNEFTVTLFGGYKAISTQATSSQDMEIW